MTRQTVIPIAHDNEYSLEHFAGQGNQALINELRQIANADRDLPAIFLWGPSGCGKTHLLLGCCQYAGQEGRRSHYINLAQDSGVLELEAIKSDELACVDGVENVPGDRVQEEWLFTLYEHCLSVGSGMVFAGQEPPSTLKFSLADLPSRLSRGGVFAVQRMNDGEKQSAIQARAKSRGMEIPDNVTGFILSRYGRDEKTLFALLDRLDSESLKSQRKITIPFLKTLKIG